MTSIVDAVSRFPETCTAVGVSLGTDGAITILAPHGLDDLFGLVLRRNPTQVRYELFLRRLADKQINKHWPKVTVVYEATDGGQ
ncbi:MAG: nucleotidyltransferase family protein [Micromonosporaceae bacterium]|nr:nucleotidyltransferase family protein [Micromonosporaceae bacterium]